MRRTSAFALALVFLAAGRAGAAAPDLAGAQLRKEQLPDLYRIEFRVDGAPSGLNILFNFHDRDNFCALELNAAGPGRVAAALSEVRNGRVAPGGPLLRIAGGQAGTIFVRNGHVLIETEEQAAAAALTVPAGGSYGAAPGKSGTFAKLTMRREEPVYFTDDFMRAEGTGEHWRPLSGKWSIRYERDTARSANPFRCIARAEGLGLMTAGESTWHEYTASVNVSGGSGSAGLAFAVRDDKNYHVFRLGLGAGKSELVRVRAGREDVLAADDRVLYEDRWYRISVRADASGIECSVDGAPLLKASSPAAVGKVGLYVTDARETLFDDVLVASSHLAAREKPPIELFSTVFESDSEMENWASLWSAWRPQTAGERGALTRRLYWHKSDFFGDVSVACRVDDRRAGWEAGLILGGDGQDAASGAVLALTGAGTTATWSLSLGGKELGSKKAPLPAGALVSLARSGGRVVASAGDAVVLRSDPVTLPGRSVAVWADGATVDLHKVEIRNDNVHDYLFEDAPVEWFPRTGTWEITNRWVCDPRWSWLGGTSEQVAQMWTKRSFDGDQTVEFFGALKMGGATKAATLKTLTGARYPHVGDINLTFCGDGKNLDSGYQVIFAGWNNRWTRLLKSGEAVAGSADATIAGNFHHRWFHIKARKTGDLVQVFFDDELVGKYRDPAPLGGGQIALWTLDNGIMISRVRICSERSTLGTCLKTGGAPAPPALKTGPAKPPEGYYAVHDDFKQGVGRWAGRDGEQGAALDLLPAGGLMLTNTNGGGSFGVTIYDRPVDLLKYPIVRLSYRTVCEDPVCLNLFAEVNGRLVELPLTAPPAPDAAATLSGGPKLVFHGKDGGPVQTATIDLGAIVTEWYRKEFRRAPLALSATELYLANASNRKYLLCGFGGNRAGARLLVLDFAIKARDGEPAR